MKTGFPFLGFAFVHRERRVTGFTSGRASASAVPEPSFEPAGQAFGPAPPSRTGSQVLKYFALTFACGKLKTMLFSVEGFSPVVVSMIEWTFSPIAQGWPGGCLISFTPNSCSSVLVTPNALLAAKPARASAVTTATTERPLIPMRGSLYLIRREGHAGFAGMRSSCPARNGACVMHGGETTLPSR